MKKIKITAFVLLLSLVSTPIHAAESSRVLEIKSSNYIQRLEIFNQGSVGIPLAQVEIHAPQGNVTFSRMEFQRIGRSEYSDFGRIWAT